MANGAGSGHAKGDTERSWDAARTAYTCSDGRHVHVSNVALRLDDRKSPEPEEKSKVTRLVPSNVILYIAHGVNKGLPYLFVSETRFDRSMSVIVKAAESSKTVTFPRTVREAKDSAF